MNIAILALNVVLAIIAAPLVDGLRRVITARLQNRAGPPVTQSWHDIVKLLRKETIPPEGAGFLVSVLPALTLTLSLAMFATISTVTTQSPIEGGGVVFIELVVLSAFAFAAAGSASRNPYGVVGGSRGVILATLVEPSIIVSLTALIVFRGSTTLDDAPIGVGFGVPLLVAAAAYLLSVLAAFDVAEAESELSGGPLMEYGGPPLAAMKLGLCVRSLALFSIPKFFITALLPPGSLGEGFSATVVALYLASVLLCTIVVSLAESLSARYRLVEASRFYAVVLAISLVALVLVYAVPGAR
ncbi:MAG: NADH-quinone oxidoreductase subunit H [Candidatus Bathyarchaeota archaeon]|nr:NADH-quinone oxidoreductase subunit H [Candidatus Bathyarchaeota archaeon]